MNFQRRHYLAVAALLAEFLHADLFSAPLTEDMAGRFADAFMRDNPRFHRARFLTACGIPETHANTLMHNGKR